MQHYIFFACFLSQTILVNSFFPFQVIEKLTTSWQSIWSPMFFLRIMYCMPFAKGSWSNYVIQLNKHVYLRVMRQDSWYSDNGRHLNNHIWCSSYSRGGWDGDTHVQKHRFFTNLFWMISISSSLLWRSFFTPFWHFSSASKFILLNVKKKYSSF